MTFTATGAMLFDSDAVSTPDTPPSGGTEGYFSNGNTTTTKGTIVPGYWLDKVGGELSSVIQALAGSLEIGSLTQLANFFLGLNFQAQPTVNPTETTSGFNKMLQLPLPGGSSILTMMSGTVQIISTGGGPFNFNFPFGGFPSGVAPGIVGSYWSGPPSGSCGFEALSNTVFQAGTNITSGAGGAFYTANWFAWG